MPKQRRKSLKITRRHAYYRQGGCCCYCHQPIWLENLVQYAQQYGLTLKKARHMQCTGEHLVAHKDGGSAGDNNIAAVCRFCNLRRHRGKKECDPKKYEQFVLDCLDKGHWHGVKLSAHT